MILLYLAIIAAIFLGDLLIKNSIEKKEKEGQTRRLFGGKLLIRKHHNQGFALNKGSQVQPFIACISLGITVFCTGIFILSLTNRGNALMRTALAIVLGGAYSNTYDRLKRKYVVDYVSFGVPSKKFSRIIFNISDFCIIIGTMILVITQSGNKEEM